ncbi:LysR substrate-binding domain-containing protein [Streptomyces sp. NPDC086010]|uniref:LysR substrate-binding domain-containing protein n=1 Tax=Streptomyces sp. NPDC086010 TaxID=3365745 RepID=UPI0037CF2FA5
MPGDLEETPRAEDRVAVLLHGGHRLAGRASQAVRLGELGEERWITGCPRSAARLPHECAEPGPAPVTSFTADDTLMVQSLAAEGLGIAMVPWSVLPFLAHGEVVGRPV